MDNWYKAVEKDPATQIPGSMVGKDLVAAKKYQAQIMKGEPLETNMNRYAELQTMAAEDPAKFKTLNMIAERGNFTDDHFEHFIKLQADMKGGKADMTSVQGANAQFDDMAKQFFGPKYASNKDKITQANQIMQAYTVRIEQVEAESGKKTTAVDRQSILNDLFMAKAPVTNKGFFGGVSSGKASLVDQEGSEYIPAITSILRTNKIPVTSANIMKEYSAWVKAGRLKELDL